MECPLRKQTFFSYPKCVVLCEEEHPAEIDGVEIPVDCTQTSPNGHVDNLYLVRLKTFD